MVLSKRIKGFSLLEVLMALTIL
ncbi:MAG: prepilin-type N-terminal cleavage/methylation domain-containing protein [Lachnospiraceae bacterium]|nr:prepilin-type N-terminal cleavage/methylation domain-containing protein [Lachnospiraceae bacterium]